MVYRALRLFIIHQVLCPALLQPLNEFWVLPLCQLNRFLIGISFAIAIQRLLVVLHLLVKLACLLEHPGTRKGTCDLLEQILRETHIIIKHHVGSFRWKPPLQVKVDRINKVSLRLLKLSRLLLLASLHQPRKVIVL